MLNVRTVVPADDPLWLELATSSGASLFHSPAWIRALEATYDFQVRAYVVTDDSGRLQGGIPFCHIDDGRGQRRVSLPFSDYCDPLFGNDAARRLLLERIAAEGIPFTLRCLDASCPPDDARWSLAKSAAWHGLSLRSDLDELWRGLHGSARRSIKKARSHGVDVSCRTDEGALDAFFRMHLHIRKHKYRLLAQPRVFFDNLRSTFAPDDRFRLLVASHEGELAAATLFLEWNGCLYYKFNASDPAALSVRPNHAIVWEAIELAKRTGLERLDFGLSDTDQEGLIRFKDRFGAARKEIRHFRFQPPHRGEQRPDELTRLLPEITRLLTDASVPDRITAEASNRLYRYFA